MADPQGGSAGPESGPSLFASLRSFWSVLLAILYTRLDRGEVELQDQGIRVIKLLLAGFVAVVLLITAFFFFNFWIIAFFWSGPYRLEVIGIIFAVYFFGGVIFIAVARNIAINWPGFLGQTIKELRKDVEGLQILVAKDKEVTK
jgi:uncharacterized membrane protein YqjE